MCTLCCQVAVDGKLQLCSLTLTSFITHSSALPVLSMTMTSLLFLATAGRVCLEVYLFYKCMEKNQRGVQETTISYIIWSSRIEFSYLQSRQTSKCFMYRYCVECVNSKCWNPIVGLSKECCIVPLLPGLVLAGNSESQIGMRDLKINT